MKQLIVCADDFGLDRAVDEAIEEAHQRGILSTASLMDRVTDRVTVLR